MYFFYRIQKIKLMLLLLPVFLLVSCSEKQDDSPIVVPKKKVVEKKEDVQEKALSEEEQRRMKLQSMRAGRNPFQSYIIDDDPGKTGPLQCCDITQFKVLAIIRGMPEGDVAKVQTPTGDKYTVGVGTKIGNREGVIYKIDEGTLFVKEKHKNVLGEKETVRVEISLPAIRR